METCLLLSKPEFSFGLVHHYGGFRYGIKANNLDELLKTFELKPNLDSDTGKVPLLDLKTDVDINLVYTYFINELDDFPKQNISGNMTSSQMTKQGFKVGNKKGLKSILGIFN